MYEIIPGFLVSIIVTYIVSKLTASPGEFVNQDLAKVKQIVKEK